MVSEWELNESELVAIAKEFQRLGDNTYLDHAGTTLYTESQIEASSKLLKENLFCNPHTCKVTGDLIDQVRFRILRHFNTNATDYVVVFMANATAGLKLVAETFHFGPEGSFYYCQENHTSVLGMREIVKTANKFVLTKDEILQNLQTTLPPHVSRSNVGNSLLVFSAQCNFSGFKMPLRVIETIHDKGLVNRGLSICEENNTENSEDVCDFYVMLDAASYVATNFLDLQRYKPDFLCVSFYKLLGYPTGVGAVLVSKRGQNVLNKQYYGGGTVNVAMTTDNFHEKRYGFADRFEDGTLSFLTIAALLDGFNTLERLIPATPKRNTMERISSYVFQLAKYCFAQLSCLRYGNGNSLLELYNHTDYADSESQGGIVTFNILRDDGTYVGFTELACLASVYNIQLRTGCFCNPGACQWFLKLTNSDIRKQFEAGHICSDYNDVIDGVPTGAVRISCGYMTRKEDIDKVVLLLKECYLDRSELILDRLKDNSNLPSVLGQQLNPKLREICIYPIKSCGSFKIQSLWPINSTGFLYDRCWMVVNSSGMAITQKHHPRMCMISPIINIIERLLILKFPGMPNVTVPLEELCADGEKVEDAFFCQSKICNDMVDGLDCGDQISAWLSDCLEMEGLRLIKQSGERRNRDGVTKSVTLANQSQFLLINRTSVRWLVQKCINEEEPLANSIDRFRANIIIESTLPLEENNFEFLHIGNIEFKVDGFCTRCQMICIDQHTGRKTAEPLNTIARELGGKMRFGIYLSLAKPPPLGAQLSCKDKIVIIKRQESK